LGYIFGDFFPNSSGHPAGVEVSRSSGVGKDELLMAAIFHQKQGCQIFLDAKYQNGDNITNVHNRYQSAIK
jgi:hypothetical protein